jgi:hypothetical protein
MLKTIIIIIAYNLNNFQYSYDNIIIDDEKIHNFKIKKRIHFLKNIYSFCQCEN